MLIISNKRLGAIIEAATSPLQMEVKAMQGAVRSAQSAALLSSIQNFTRQIFPSWLVVQEMDVYRTADDVYSVVSRLATTAAMIPFKAVDGKGKEVPQRDRLNIVLTNLDFSTRELMYTYLFTAGEVFLYKNVLDEGVNKGLNSLQPMNPARMVVVLSNDFPTYVVGYQYRDTQNGIVFDLELDEVIHIKFPNPTINIQEEWRGLSPIKVLAQRLTRLQAGLDASVSQMQNGGVPGIVYDKSPGLDAGVVGNRRDNFGKYLRNSANKGAPYFSANDLGYISLGLPLADMEVAALAKVDFKKICNAYAISDVLFNNDVASTESNVKEMIKLMYTNAVLPNVCRIVSALNKEAVPDVQTVARVREDISGIQELQTDRLAQAQAIAAMPILIPNKALESIGEDPYEDEEMDKPWIKTGYTRVEDAAIDVMPVDNEAGDYQQTATDAATKISKML